MIDANYPNDYSTQLNAKCMALLRDHQSRYFTFRRSRANWIFLHL